MLHLTRGCCTREEREDGTTRYKVTGRHFKGVTDDEGNAIPEGEIRPDPWVVLEFVASAIAVVEELESGQLLFSRSFSRAYRRSLEIGDAVPSDMATKRIAGFIAWANEQAIRHDRPHELIPEDPEGPVALRRFRRTIAWFIHRQPGGRIALGVQFGHAATLMGESYAARSKADMLELLDFEKGLALAEALSEARERIAAGEGVSGPAAGRYIAAATEFENRYAGTYLGKQELRALAKNPKLQVYEDSKAFLTCNFDAFKALCDPELSMSGTTGQNTPDRSRCNPACANISRTDSQIAGVQAEIDTIDSAAEAGLDPYPIARREQQWRAVFVQIIERHRAAAIPNSQTREKSREPGPGPAGHSGTGAGRQPGSSGRDYCRDSRSGSRPRLRCHEPGNRGGRGRDQSDHRRNGPAPGGAPSAPTDSSRSSHWRKRPACGGTNKHTGLKDLFYALVKAQQGPPKAFTDKERELSEQQKKDLARVRAERDSLRSKTQQLARIVHVLEVENHQLRASAGADGVVRVLPVRR
ncbi:hypothetical protein [Streptomyces nojiriensis]|uniref:hypothetical protein n=1 Tax=Streptomyces nojiriensis TaxID=66374 RepID=UPI0035E30A37